MHFDQAEFDLRCDWALAGLQALAPGSHSVIIVDVLSFGTAVDIAVANGAVVLPYRWKEKSAAEFAREKGALLAAARSAAGAYSLSPASLLSIPAGTALVLPSPNGSALSFDHAGGGPVFAACLRNAPAVARRAASLGRRIAVIPAGERWTDGSLRPCLEDYLGAGAVLAELQGTKSPESEMAVAAFERFRGSLGQAVAGCSSGRELVERGFERDLELAAAYAASEAVPLLRGDRFLDARRLD